MYRYLRLYMAVNLAGRHYVYQGMRRVAPVLLALTLLPAFAFAAKKAPPALAASAYVAKDTHEKEKVTVAAEPFDSRDKGEFFRVDYYGHSLMPIRLIIQNDSDAPLDLNQARIQLIGEDGTKLPAATPEEMNRRLFRFNDIKERHIPGTPINYHKAPVDKKILDDDKDFGFSQTIVPPHTSASGFLFYDVRDLDDPPLRGAELYVKMIHTAGADKKDAELFAFSVPFDKYLEQEKARKAAEKAADAVASDKDKKDKSKP